MDAAALIDKLTKIGLSTEPADRPKAEAAISSIYRSLGMNESRKFVWHNSVMEIARKYDMFLTDSSYEYDKTHRKIFDIYRNNRNKNNDTYKDKLDRSFRVIAFNEGCKRTRNIISIVDFSETYLRPYKIGLGQFISPFHAFTIGSTVDAELQPYLDLIESLRSWYLIGPLDVLIERPNLIKLDEEYRLHCEDGPAYGYRDGRSLYCIHGVYVDPEIVRNPHLQTISQIEKEQNAEVKRIRIERYGWEKYLINIDAQIIDNRRNDVECTLESLMKTHNLCVLLCHCPSTGRIYTMEVPLNIKTCEEAQNYLWSAKKVNIIGRS